MEESTTASAPPASPPKKTVGANGNATSLTATNRHGAALRRIGDYYVCSINQKDPLDAALGVYNADLLWIGAHVQEAIKNYLKDGPNTVDQILKVKPVIDTVLQLARQVDRFSQIEIQERRRQDAAAALADKE